MLCGNLLDFKVLCWGAVSSSWFAWQLTKQKEEEGEDDENGALGKRAHGESDEDEDDEAAPAQTKRKK